MSSPLTIQPSAKDVFLRESNPTTNYGSNSNIVIAGSLSPGLDTAAIRFDFSALPVNAVISSAILSMYYHQYSPDDPVGRTYKMCRCTRTDWVELEATWNNYKSGSAWTSPGGDYTETDAAEAVVPASLGWIDWNITALAQWFQANAGKIADLILKDRDAGTAGKGYQSYFYTNDYPDDTSQRPKLVITYTIPGFAHSQTMII